MKPPENLELERNYKYAKGESFKPPNITYITHPFDIILTLIMKISLVWLNQIAKEKLKLHIGKSISPSEEKALWSEVGREKASQQDYKLHFHFLSQNSRNLSSSVLQKIFATDTVNYRKACLASTFHWISKQRGVFPWNTIYRACHTATMSTSRRNN